MNHPQNPLLVLLLGAFSAIAAPYDINHPPLSPDPKLTPGASISNVPITVICQTGYTKTIRHVPESLKRKVFISYFGRVPDHPGDFEIDHLISCELNGAQDARNLWPQSYKTYPLEARSKDTLENWMARDVRRTLLTQGTNAATILLRQHQDEISTNWIGAWKRYIKK